MSLTTAQLEETLKIRSWGKWAKPRIERELGAKCPWWVDLMKEGWRESSRDYVEPITDEYGLMLDRMISATGEESRLILTSLYCFGYGVNLIASNSRYSKYDVRSIRDSALNQLYGALHLVAELDAE